MTNKEKQAKALYEGGNVEVYPSPNAIKKVMSFLGKKRWEGKSKEERSKHMKAMRKKRKSYPQRKVVSN